MAELRFPQRLPRENGKKTFRTCAAHRKWVKRHRCCVGGCRQLPIECAHVRIGTDGGVGLKPSDKWTISLCQFHHRQQHDIGEREFEARHEIDLHQLAREFARKSPYRQQLSGLAR
jgi:hypothetical protein